MLKKLRSSLLPLLLLFCFLFPQTVLAAGASVIDDADLFSTSEEELLTEQMTKLINKTGMDYLVVTTNDARGMSAQDYADTAYGNSDAGADALLYLIDMDNREIYIYTQGEMIRYLTDERIEDMLDEAFEDAADGDYYDSAYSVLWAAGEYYDEGIRTDQHNYDEVTGEVDYYYEEEDEGYLVFGIIIGMLIGLVIGGIAALIKYFSVKNEYNLTYDTYYYPLSEKSELNLTVSEDRLTGKFVTHRRIPKENNSPKGGASGRSTIHHASSGRTHGGGGRKF